ncbi:MAG: hypothetical protein HC892_19785, partial [Saprospiraceae bacterium]|nr:hypothetical protein [Saprospiraceae bacterium]
LDLGEVPKDFQDIANYLEEPLKDENFRRNLKAEQEIDEIFSHQEAELARKDEALREARQREEEARQREEEARQREEEARQKEEEAKQRQQFIQLQFAKHLLATDVPIEQIVQMTGLTEEVVTTLK